MRLCPLQLVLDANGDQRITEEEILTAAKDILAKLKTEGTQGTHVLGVKTVQTGKRGHTARWLDRRIRSMSHAADMHVFTS